MMAFNHDLLTQLLPCFQWLFSVLETCLLGCAYTFVPVYHERSPQNSSAAGRLLVHWKVCAFPRGKSFWLWWRVDGGYHGETLKLCPPAHNKLLLERGIENRTGVWGWLSSKAPTQGLNIFSHCWQEKSIAQGFIVLAVVQAQLRGGPLPCWHCYQHRYWCCTGKVKTEQWNDLPGALVSEARMRLEMKSRPYWS